MAVPRSAAADVRFTGGTFAARLIPRRAVQRSFGGRAADLEVFSH
jgi:hypothetical protein